MKISLRTIYINVVRFVILAVLVFLWELASGGIYEDFELISPLIIGRPSLIAEDFIRYVTSDLFIRDLSATMQATIWGLIIGIVSGVGLGIIFAYSKFVEDTFRPFVVAINTLPRPALAPLITIWFGFGIISKILVSWSIVFFIIFFNTIQGIKSIDPDLIKVVKVMGSGRMGIIRHIILPAIATWVFAAFRVSVSFALIGAVIGEFVGAHAGLGYRILVASGLFETNRVFTVLIILMILGICLVKFSEYVENKVLKWKPPTAIY